MIQTVKPPAKNIININDNLQKQLLSESTEFRTSAKQLRENSEKSIRQADKVEMSVILDKNNYLDKLQPILDDDLNKIGKKVISTTDPSTTP